MKFQAATAAILVTVLALPATALDKDTEAALDAAIAGEHRSERGARGTKLNHD